MLCDINYLVICKIFSVVFSVYFADVVRSSIEHISGGDVAHCIPSYESARSINTIVPRSLILMLFMQSVLVR